MSEMGSQRQGEIALKILKHLMRQKGAILSPKAMKRDFGNLAKAIDVDRDELVKFSRPLMLELLDECFPAQ